MNSADLQQCNNGSPVNSDVEEQLAGQDYQGNGIYMCDDIDVARKNSNRYLTIFNNMEQGFCIIEVLFNEAGRAIDYLFLETNPVFEKQTGLKNAVGKTIKELKPAQEEHWLQQYGDVVTTGRSVHFESEAGHLIGDTWYEVFAVPIDKPEKKQVAVFFNDITERKKAEARQAFLIKLNDALRQIAAPAQVQAVAAGLLGEFLKVDQSYYGEVVGDYAHISYGDGDALSTMTAKFRCKHFGEHLVQAYRAGKVQVCCDTGTDPTIAATDRDGLISAHTGAYIGVPLVKDEEWVAVLAVHTIKPRKWKQEEIDLVLEVAERTWATVERAKVEELLKKELEDTKKLQQFSIRVVEENNIEALYEALMESAMDLMHADMASIQTVDPKTNELLLLTYKGFHPHSAETWQRITIESTTSCGVAFAKNERIIYSDVDDVEMSKIDRDAYRLSGIIAMQSTPLISRSGKPLGMISTHWKKKHQPSIREFNLFDVLARHAADIIEQKQAKLALHESEAWLNGQKEAFQAAMSGQSLATSLDALIQTVVAQTGGDARASFYLIPSGGEGLHLVAGMSEEYARDINGFEVGPESLACGLAMHTGKAIITPDVEVEPLWEPWRQIARKHQYRACWSFPVRTAGGPVVGTFAMYFEHPRNPTPRELELAGIVAHAAAIIISRDTELNERTEAENALRKNELHLKQLLKQKDEFIGIASHELKTPITSMKTYAEILLETFEEMEDKPSALLMEKLDKQIDRLTNLTKDLLDTGKISEGHLQLFMEEIDLNNLVSERLEELKRISPAHQIIFIENKLKPVTVDKERMGQVITNLVSNAIKYSPAGGEVVVSTQMDENNHVKVSVRDQGIGISQEEQHRVFERFYRVNDVKTQHFSGMGLGLYISSQIISRHNGEIAVQSEEGKGSVFSFTIPLNMS